MALIRLVLVGKRKKDRSLIGMGSGGNRGRVTGESKYEQLSFPFHR